MPIITIAPREQEQAALRQLIDALLRHAGAGTLNVATHFTAKLAATEDRRNAAPPTKVMSTASEK